MTEQETNPYDYTYSGNQTIEIPANVMMNLFFYFQKVLASQPNLGIPYVYAKDTKVSKNKDGIVTGVETDWAHFENLESFLKTIENPIPIATEIGILTEQFSYSFMKIHQDNIEKGIAKKIGKLTKEQEDEEFSQLLSKSNKK